MMPDITCFIYRCSAKPDMYIYLSEKDNFACIPDELYKRLGRTDFAMDLELKKDTKLAREKPADVIENLRQRGFHLQMPSDTSIDQVLENIAKDMLEQARHHT